MSSSFEDDDEVFYGGGSSKPSESTPSYSEKREVSEHELEDQIRKTRQDRRRAGEYHDVTRLRQKAAEHRADAAKFFKKYRFEEAAMVKNQQYAARARRKAEGYLEKNKDVLVKADNKQADLQYLEAGKAERARIKIAKYKGKAAKCKSKASKFEAKAAKHTQKAAAKRQKAKANLEKSKLHEAEALNFRKRADNLEKAQGH